MSKLVWGMVATAMFAVTAVAGASQVAAESSTGAVRAGPGPQADATIARFPIDDEVTGYRVFNTTGQGQTVSWRVKRGGQRAFDVVVENSGSASGRIDIKGCSSSRGFRVRYENLDGANVTSAVVEGTYGQTRDEGATVFASMIIKATRKAEVGKTKVCKATGISAANRDVVKAELKVKRG